MRHSVETVDPQRTHGARLLLGPSVHVLIDYQRLGRIREQSGQMDFGERTLFFQLGGAPLKNGILRFPLRRPAAPAPRSPLSLIPDRAPGLTHLPALAPVGLALNR